MLVDGDRYRGAAAQKRLPGFLDAALLVSTQEAEGQGRMLADTCLSVQSGRVKRSWVEEVVEVAGGHPPATSL